MITIGADPEFFIKDRQTGTPTPICGLLGGTKGAAIPVGNYGLQEDNVMAEYNIPPCSDVLRFARHITSGRAALMDYLNARNVGQFEADLSPARLFPHMLLEHPQAKQFGCSPDFDAYTLGQPNRRVDPQELTNPRGAWRFSGGHVHIGYKEDVRAEMPEYVVAQFADVFLGLRSVAWDKQGERRKFYGTAGRYRPTPYGIEYRTMSNIWTYDVGTAENIGNSAMLLGIFLRNKEAVIRKAWAEIPWQDVKRSIDTEDAALATTLIRYCNSLGLDI